MFLNVSTERLVPAQVLPSINEKEGSDETDATEASTDASTDYETDDSAEETGDDASSAAESDDGDDAETASSYYTESAASSVGG